MRNYSTISDEERAQILNTHRSFYDGYATGNVPSNQTPLTVEDLAQDKQGLQVTNTGEVKPYNNHIREQAIIPTDDMDLYNVEPPYNFVSDGPEDGELVMGEGETCPSCGSDVEDCECEGHDHNEMSEGDDGYKMDIEGIMDMFGGDMSPADVDIVFDDGEERDEFEDYFDDSEEGDPYQYIEDGGFMDEEMYEEVEDDLQESFREQRKIILETFNRFNKFN
tara:strand:- start:1817 stop:2482 length:666 start_codon:yes stop_codon:yes gene_type:complete